MQQEESSKFNCLKTNRQLVVVGISGATCGGKTTLSKLLQATFPWATVVHQDAYFHPNDPKYHVYLPEIDCYNWELETALDFLRMETDVKNLIRGRPVAPKGAAFFDNMEFVLAHQPPPAETECYTKQFSKVPIIILEGHILFNRPFFYEICNQKFFLKLSKEECYKRRQSRVYSPMPPAGFFDVCVWPSYENRLRNVECLEGITFVDCKDVDLMEIYQQMKTRIVNAMTGDGDGGDNFFN